MREHKPQPGVQTFTLIITTIRKNNAAPATKPIEHRGELRHLLLMIGTGAKVLTGRRVASIEGGEAVTGVKLADGELLKVDVVVLGIGASPNSELAAACGLELGFRKGIRVDSHMRTVTDPNVFACGDCCTKPSFFDGTPSGVMLASIATIINGRAFGVAGLTERAAKEAGKKVVVATAEASDTHPGGMPDSTMLKVKLVFSQQSGILLGGSVSGGKSTGEMVNVLSASILHRMTVDDIVGFQMGTHPALTASPIAYPIVNAACKAVLQVRKG